jgi:type II secretory pathway pseudopilin PulG
MTERNDDDKYVTFKWLIGSILTVILIMGSFATIIITSVSSRIDSKVDKELFALQSAAIQRSFDLQTTNIATDVAGLKTDIKELSDFIKSTHQVPRTSKR